jgi:hypothetical protein
VAIVCVPTSRITDRGTFHDVFADLMGFPSFYGRNMDAWIDCMSSVDSPGDGMSTVTVPAGGVLTLVLEDAETFRVRYSILYADLVECAAFVNMRRASQGQDGVIAVAFAS